MCAPDVAFVRRERAEAAGRMEGFWPGAPDLAVEVVSPSGTHAEVTGKVMVWLGAGCRMVLVAVPEQGAVTVYRSREDVRILVGGARDIIDSPGGKGGRGCASPRAAGTSFPGHSGPSRWAARRTSGSTSSPTSGCATA